MTKKLLSDDIKCSVMQASLAPEGMWQRLSMNSARLNTYDLIEIDSATFKNYAAGEMVKDATIQSVSESTDLKGTVVTAEKEDDLRKQNFNANGDGLLGFAADTGTLIYSTTGNFSADAEELLEIGKVEGDNFLASKQINVI